MVLEISLEKWFFNEIKKRGGYCLKLGYITGIPDRLVLLPGGRVGFVELKRKKTGVAAPLQRKWVSKLIAIGFKAEVIDNRSRLEEFLNEL